MKDNHQTNGLCSIRMATQILKCSEGQLRYWEDLGLFKPTEYTAGGHRRYKINELEDFAKTRGLGEVQWTGQNLAKALKVAGNAAKIKYAGSDIPAAKILPILEALYSLGI